jgi:hypothetical protein
MAAALGGCLPCTEKVVPSLGPNGVYALRLGDPDTSDD